MDLAEAELESNPEERDTSRDPDVMIEYSSHHNNEVPLFSSLTSYKSLPRGPNGPILLSEPISPPKQFDSSYTGYGAGLRVQPHSIHGQQGRDETY